MSRELFYVTSVNPNDTCGGGGCACSESKVSDCLPPYAVFPGTETDNNLSPHVVVCLKCMNAACEQAKIEVLAAGEVNGTLVEDDDVPGSGVTVEDELPRPAVPQV